MSIAPAADEVLQQRVQNSLESLLDVIREIVRQEMAGEPGGEPADLGNLKEELRAEIRKDLLAAGGSSVDVVATCIAKSGELFSSGEWKKHVNALIQEAFQSVLPSMIKRFRAEMEKVVPDSVDGGGGVSLDSVVNSVEMKEMLEERFRTMLLYLKQEVIPRAIQGMGAASQ